MLDLSGLLADSKNDLDSASKILIGYSGGLDSSVLLAAVSGQLDRNRILAVHINHDIQQDADRWQEHCQHTADSLDVPFYSEKVRVGDGAGLEDRARQARYKVFERLLGSGDILLLGHHADDQVETFLFRLFRGSGVKGLAAIPPKRRIGKGLLVRPLLGYSKQELKALAVSEEIKWIEDPSNLDIRFDRNFIRNELLLLVKDRWTAADKQLLGMVDMFRETDELLSEIAEEDLRACDHRVEPVGESIEISSLSQLTPLRQNNMLRRFVYLRRGTQPNQSFLSALRSEVLDATEDAQPCLRQADIEVRRYHGRLYLTRVLSDVVQRPDYAIDWPAEQGKFQLSDVWELSKANDCEVDLRIDFRRGGERAKPMGRDRSQSLKKLLHEYQIEPWLRDWIPIIYCGGEIVAVGDRIHCSKFRFQMHWLIERSD